MRRALLLAPLLAAIVASPAAAGTVTWAPSTPEISDDACGKIPAPCGVAARPASIGFGAAPGERDVVTVTAPEPGVLVLRDEAGVTLAGTAPACTPLDAQTVSCLAGLVTSIRLGDGDDVASVPLAVPLGLGGVPGVLGEEGDDVIAADSASGGRGDDRLDGSWLEGGPGADVLTGTEGHDQATVAGGDTVSLLGGDDDVLLDGTGGNVVDAGPGRDTASYGTSATGVTVDLAGGPATDTVAQVESVLGSPGPDVITGTDLPERIDGNDGADVLRGMGGDDVLISAPRTGPGSRLEGGAGVDRLLGLAFDDLNDCGPGGGVTALADGEVTPYGITTDFRWPVRTASCAAPAPAAVVAVAKAGRVGLQELHCGAGAGTVTGCEMTLAVSVRGRRVAMRTLELAPGTSTVERAALPVRERRRIQRRGGRTRVVLRVTRVVAFRDGTQVTDVAGPLRLQVKRRDLR